MLRAQSFLSSFKHFHRIKVDLNPGEFWVEFILPGCNLVSFPGSQLDLMNKPGNKASKNVGILIIFITQIIVITAHHKLLS